MAKDIKKKEESTFSKASLLQSKMFEKNRDALHVILEDGEEYTIKDVETRLDEFMKGREK